MTTLALTLLPLILAAVLAAFVSVWWFQQKEKIQWHCESHNFKAQQALTVGMEQLLKLNPLIQWAFKQQAFLRKALLAAPHPAAKALIQAQLLRLRLQLLAYKAQQTFAINSSLLLANKEVLAARHKILAEVQSMQRQWGQPLRFEFESGYIQHQLKEEKLDKISSLYLEHDDLPVAQKISFEATISGKRLFPKWLPLVTQHPLHWTETCITQPRKENQKWDAQIILDKL